MMLRETLVVDDVSAFADHIDCAVAVHVCKFTLVPPLVDSEIRRDLGAQDGVKGLTKAAINSKSFGADVCPMTLSGY